MPSDLERARNASQSLAAIPPREVALDAEVILREAGFTGKYIQDMAELTDEEFDQFVEDNVDAAERADRDIMRRLLHRRRAAEGT